MKKIMVIALIIFMTLAMAACGGSASDSGGGMAEESKSSGSYGFGNFLADGSEQHLNIKVGQYIKDLGTKALEPGKIYDISAKLNNVPSD